VLIFVLPYVLWRQILYRDYLNHFLVICEVILLSNGCTVLHMYTYSVCEMMGISCIAEQPLAAQESICSVELYYIILTIDGIVK
jgi:hypothetical protein